MKHIGEYLFCIDMFLLLQSKENGILTYEVVLQRLVNMRAYLAAVVNYRSLLLQYVDEQPNPSTILHDLRD